MVAKDVSGTSRAGDIFSRLLSPKGIAGGLSLLLCVTTTQYFFAPPQLNREQVQKDFLAFEDLRPKYYHNFYGAPDAEFDWCESNYVSLFLLPYYINVPSLLSSFEIAVLGRSGVGGETKRHEPVVEFLEIPVAEFWNTLSSFLYILPVLTVWWYRPAPNYIYSAVAKRGLLFLTSIFIGTTLFHATLRYWAHLIDELPIYYIMVNANVGVWATRRRMSEKVATSRCYSTSVVKILAGILAGLLSIGILATVGKEYATTHQALRGILSTSFSAMFVHLFYVKARLLEELTEATGAHRKNTTPVSVDEGKPSGEQVKTSRVTGSTSGKKNSKSVGRGKRKDSSRGRTPTSTQRVTMRHQRAEKSRGRSGEEVPSGGSTALVPSTAENLAKPEDEAGPRTSITDERRRSLRDGSEKDHLRQSVAEARSLFHLAFLEFLIGIVCWIVDNGFCTFLRTRLPFYPQTHAWWHFFTTLGLYHMLVMTEMVEKVSATVVVLTTASSTSGRPLTSAKSLNATTDSSSRPPTRSKSTSSRPEKNAIIVPVVAVPGIKTVWGGFVHVLDVSTLHTEMKSSEQDLAHMVLRENNLASSTDIAYGFLG
ncbi:unnamed protein product [Amoebophrya sp. A25]|nr:unnamed protein product [Amoebophrya sp. A25]|eukprot:GSA25T00012078001.1